MRLDVQKSNDGSAFFEGGEGALFSQRKLPIFFLSYLNFLLTKLGKYGILICVKL